MNHAIQFTHVGNRDVLQWQPLSLPETAPYEVRLRHTAIGVNYIDTYHRSGLYPLPLPSGLGVEAAGVVEAVGEGVTDLQVGDRVAYAGGTPGAYAEYRTMPAARLVKLPDDIRDETAAAMMLKGLTAEYLLRRTYTVQPGDTILIHAAAGGVGLIACQWVKALGATVIGTVSTAAKAELAAQHGCDYPLIVPAEDFVARVKAITQGRGVPVVYDGVGQSTFAGSLDCLTPRGLLVAFGNASGPIPPIDPLLLSNKGSLFFTRPTLGHYIASREELLAASQALFDVVRSGAVRIEINQRFALADAAAAHQALEARQTTGSTILLP